MKWSAFINKRKILQKFIIKNINLIHQTKIQVPSNPWSQIWRQSAGKLPPPRLLYQHQAHSLELKCRGFLDNKKGKKGGERHFRMKAFIRILQTRCQPFSFTFISALPSLTRNDKANKFSTVCAKEFLFKTKFSSLTLLLFFKILNIVAIFLSVSVLSFAPLSLTCTK